MRPTLYSPIIDAVSAVLKTHTGYTLAESINIGYEGRDNRRWAAEHLVLSGVPPKVVADVFGLTPSGVLKLRKSYAERTEKHPSLRPAFESLTAALYVRLTNQERPGNDS